MKYLKFAFINIFFFLLSSNAHSTLISKCIKNFRGINHHMVRYYSNSFPYLNENLEGLVPNYDGKMQSLKDFHLYFSPYQKNFSFQIINNGTFNKSNKFDLSLKVAGSGVAAENLLFTAAHNFITKKNKKYHNYDEELGIRFPDEFLFGLTTEEFIPDDINMFYDPRSFYSLKPHPQSLVYKRISIEEIDDIYIHPLYIIDKRMKNGIFYSDVDPRYDIARLKLKSQALDNLIFLDVSSKKPGNIEDIIIYQYPLGHPIQKSSIGKAYQNHPKINIDYCHDSINFPGSSGSPLIDKKGEVIGIHTKGIFKRDSDGKIILDDNDQPLYIANGYVPLKKENIDEIDFSILKLKH